MPTDTTTEQKMLAIAMAKDEQIQELLSLVDGAYEIVEIYKPESPSAIEWRKRWLARANRFGICGE